MPAGVELPVALDGDLRGARPEVLEPVQGLGDLVGGADDADQVFIVCWSSWCTV